MDTVVRVSPESHERPISNRYCLMSCPSPASAVQNELDALSSKYDNTVGTLLNVTERPDHLSGLVEVSGQT